jgi:hypothetical protein
MAWHLRGVMQRQPPIDQPFAISIRFYFKRLKKKVKYPINRRDLDNLCKLILDTGNLLVWRDDELAIQLHAYKEFSDTPRTEIIVYLVEEEEKDVSLATSKEGGEDGRQTQVRSRKAGDGMPRSQIRKETKKTKQR